MELASGELAYLEVLCSGQVHKRAELQMRQVGSTGSLLRLVFRQRLRMFRVKLLARRVCLLLREPQLQQQLDQWHPELLFLVHHLQQVRRARRTLQPTRLIQVMARSRLPIRRLWDRALINRQVPHLQEKVQLHHLHLWPNIRHHRQQLVEV